MSSRATSFGAWAFHESNRFSEQDILVFELDRARHALAYLKGKLGNDAIRDLLTEDFEREAAEVASWLSSSRGAWRSKWIELVVPHPSAAKFHEWYGQMFIGDRQELLRAGHPEHFVNRSAGPASAEVIENIGETELPWWVSYQPVDDSDLPVEWRSNDSVHFASQLRDREGRQIGFTMHEGHDEPNGMHLRMTTVLPAATPDEVFHRHLRHYAIEFRNWTEFAWRELSGVS